MIFWKKVLKIWKELMPFFLDVHFPFHLYQMTEHMMKTGEKATLLSQCGEILFGCSGETKVTQGIYISRPLTANPFSFVCKRSVWVPHCASHEHFASNLRAFGVTLPFSVSKAASLHRLGLCGLNPKRTIRAKDTQFFLLAKFPTKRFSVYGVVVMNKFGPKSEIFIDSITVNKDDVLNCVEWVKNEATLYQLTKELKTKDNTSAQKEEPSDKEDSEIEMTPSSHISQISMQTSMEHNGADLESDLSVTTPENQTMVQLDPSNSFDSPFSFY